MELEAQEQEIAEKEDIIRQQLEDIIGVKSLIIQELTEAFKESGLNIEIDQSTGAIRFPGKILFATNSTELSDEGEQFLREFVPKYLKILMDDRFRSEIANILIEGHTDNVGTYMSNMDLSQGRAYSVFKFIYSDELVDFREKELAQQFITVNGKSYSQPLNDEAGHYNPERSRRVEFLFRLKDEESIKELENLVNAS
ncbi:OmpA family protein [Paenibacillus chungangensis]|uniref:OmpA family protein n=1 Tax=Paenibacillus chungangensis TaxID=696535 RepID=A0ABW3HSS8_9BACL